MARVGAQQNVPEGLGIRLTEAPVDRKDDPRARSFIIDHVAPGSSLSRKFEVTNGTDRPISVELYGAPAQLEDGAFVPSLRGATSDLASWVKIDPPTVEVPPGGAVGAVVTITVPADASEGERYGIVAAEGKPEGSGTVNVVPRVGIRIYLSVGEGGEPASDFVVDSLQAGREDDGTPVVLARVENTGGRALDMRGELSLDDGPGGLSAGPFPAELGTTIGPGQSSPVRIALDPEIPDGPWHARLALQSGELERKVEATITFPEKAGTMEDAVDADPVEAQRKILIPIAGVTAALALGAATWVVRGRRIRRR
jgi:hypothetical protein